MSLQDVFNIYDIWDPRAVRGMFFTDSPSPSPLSSTLASLAPTGTRQKKQKMHLASSHSKPMQHMELSLTRSRCQSLHATLQKQLPRLLAMRAQSRRALAASSADSCLRLVLGQGRGARQARNTSASASSFISSRR